MEERTFGMTSNSLLKKEKKKRIPFYVFAFPFAVIILKDELLAFKLFTEHS